MLRESHLTASREPIELTLTNQWLWEIIDEFVYQFQSFSQFRRSPKLNSDELAYIKDHNYIWSVLSVLNVLHALIEKSNINQQLKVNSNITHSLNGIDSLSKNCNSCIILGLFYWREC